MRTEDHSSFVAAKAIAEAERYLRHGAEREQLAAAANELVNDLFLLPGAGDPISDPTRLLVIAMLRASACMTPDREERWRDIVFALSRLVRLEARAHGEAQP